MPMSPRLLRPRASGFNPKSISGLKLWLDIANRSSLTFNGSTVSQVNDLSGNGFHATQSTANNQPTYEAAGLNSKPTLYFDTTDSVTSSATISDYILTPTSSPTFYLMMVAYMPAVASSGIIIFGSDAQAGGRVFFSNFFGGTTMFLDSANASGGRLSATLTESDYLTPVVLTAFRNGASMGVRRNGVSVASKSNASGNYSVTTAKLQLGKCDGGGSNIMYLSECVVYAAALSASDLAKAERGLGKKWGVTVA